MKPRLILHTKMTGEIVLSIFLNNTEQFAEISMGTNPKAARDRASQFIGAMKEVEPDDITDKIT